MGFLKEKLVTNVGGHAIEIRGQNDVLRGLIYKLFIDGEEVANAQNFLKTPTERTLEAKVTFDGTEHQIVVEVKQRMLTTEYAMTVDGESMALERVD